MTHQGGPEVLHIRQVVQDFFLALEREQDRNLAAVETALVNI
jgi:hypothetical protein